MRGACWLDGSANRDRSTRFAFVRDESGYRSLADGVQDRLGPTIDPALSFRPGTRLFPRKTSAISRALRAGVAALPVRLHFRNRPSAMIVAAKAARVSPMVTMPAGVMRPLACSDIQLPTRRLNTPLISSGCAGAG